MGNKAKRIAHRGFSSEAPENTTAAFALAAEGDFFGVECDIWKSKDGVYVVSHDNHLSRMCLSDGIIPKMTYDQIYQYPVVKGKKNANYATLHIPTFRQYLSIIARSDVSHPVIELKALFNTAELGEVLDLVKEFELYDRAYFISMHQSVLLLLKEQCGFPAERLQYVYGVPRPSKTLPVSMELEQWLIDNRINLDTRYTLLSEGNVMRLHKAGIQINVWTVNRKEDFLRLENWGVDMITTEKYFR